MNKREEKYVFRERFWIIQADTTLKMGELLSFTYPFLDYGLHLVTSLQRVETERKT